MSQQLLSTKLFVVRPQTGLVDRERLIERIDGIRSRRLSVISAPAGFGKTSLISTWIDRSGFPTAWISLDKGDNDLHRFLSYLVAALRTLHPTLGSGLLEMLAMSALPPVETLLSGLINELSALPEEFLLVLTDHHLIVADDVHEALFFFVDHAPATVRMAITTRVDPPLPLARLRLRGELLEIRVADLRFSTEEADALFNGRMALGLSQRQLGVLQEKTEGWIAGLQMAALSLEGRNYVDAFVRAFDGADRYVLDYLLEEVLSRQPKEIVRVMLALSILSRFNGALCEAVTETEDGAGMLERLERANLFLISLDTKREWYRYHHLFCDLLRHRLGQSEPEVIAELHWRASRWLEANGDLLEALDHARQSEDPELIAEMVDRHWLVVLKIADGEDMVEILKKIPETIIDSSNRLRLVKCWGMYFTREFDALEETLTAIQQAVPEPGNDEERDIVRQTYMLRAVMARDHGVLEDAITFGERSLELIPEDDRSPAGAQGVTSRGLILTMLGGAYDLAGRVREGTTMFEEGLRFSRTTGDRFNIVGALGNLGRSYSTQGRFADAIRCVREIRDMQESAGYKIPGPQSIPWQIETRVFYEKNQIDEAMHAARQAVEVCSRFPAAQFLEINRMMLLVAVAAGDLDEARRRLKAMQDLPLSGPDQKFLAVVRMMRAHMATIEGNRHEAADWVAFLEGNSPGVVARVTTGSYLFRSNAEILYARILNWIGRRDDAIALLKMKHADLLASGVHTLACEAGALLSILLAAGGNPDALDMLEETLKLGAPEGLIRSFVNEGAPMARLLEKYRVSRWKPGAVPADYFQAVMDACGAAGSGIAVAAAATRSTTIDDPDALTSRELEILRLMSIGYSNQKIADKLYLSINTVKTHISNLFDKLGARNRVDALVRAREAGVLE